MTVNVRLILLSCLSLLFIRAAAQTSQHVRSGMPTTPVTFPSGCVYQWTNSDPAIGLEANGSGNIPSFTAINRTSTPVTAVVNATPISTYYAYIPDADANNVSVIDLSSNTVITKIRVGQYPVGVTVSPDGTQIYITNQKSNTVSVIDATTNRVIGNIPVGNSPAKIAFSPDGGIAYVSNYDSNTVSVINTASRLVIATIPTDWDPSSMVVSLDGSRVFVVSNGLFKIDVIDVATKTVTIRYDTQISPDGLVLSPDGKKLYVTNLGSNGLTSIDLTTGMKNSIAIGKVPQEVVMSPDGSHLYITDFYDDLVIVVDVASFSVITKIHTGNATSGISITADGKKVLAVNTGAKTVSVINTATNQVDATIPVGNLSYALGSFIREIPAGTCQPVTYTFTIDPTGPSINGIGSPAALNTQYGNPSSSTSFMVSGDMLTEAILVTPPAGFELSLDNVNFSPTLTIGGAGTVSTQAVYIRLKQTSNAGSFSGNINLTSAGAPGAAVAIPLSVVTPAPLTLQAASATKIYGELLQGGSGYTAFTATGLKNSERAGSVIVAYGMGAAPGATVGAYTNSVSISNVTGGTFLASNYNIVYHAGNLTVTPKTIEVTAFAQRKKQGEADPALTYQLNSGSLVGTDGFNGELIRDAGELPGVYIIRQGSLSLNSNYILKYQEATLTIEQVNAVLTFQPLPAKTYGDSDFDLNASSDHPEISIDYQSENLSVAAIINGKIHIVGAGTTNIVASQQRGTNFEAALPVTRQLTVLPAAIHITSQPATKTYGSADPSLNYLVTGGRLFGNDSFSGLLVRDVGEMTGVYAIRQGSLTAGPNYNIIYTSADLKIEKAVLTIRADDQQRFAGMANPDFTLTYTGFVTGETSSVLNVPPVISTTANIKSPPGQYAITVGSASAVNYTINYIDGILTILRSVNNNNIPNAFTPNGDGINDNWNLGFLVNYPKCVVQIFNRTGSLVFFSNGYGIAWDGTYNGSQLPAGVYYYVIDPREGSDRISGNVSIIR